ncbi:hypothetical protein [Ancylobacter sp.]|uniref:hypothetical protein n=1 Tax=Ancylobacter sp. TaxID=1872567 RepID=UPI003C7AB258
MSDFDLHEMNGMHVNLNQATLGLNDNFRMVAFTRESGVWIFKFYLDHEDEDDREEVEDIMTQIEAIEGSDFKAEFEIIVGNEPIAWPEHPARVVFRNARSKK